MHNFVGLFKLIFALMILVLVFASPIVPTVMYVEERVVLEPESIGSSVSSGFERVIVEIAAKQVYGSIPPARPRAKPFDPLSVLVRAARSVDRDGNGISDSLERMVLSGRFPEDVVYDNSTGRVAVIVVFNVTPARSEEEARVLGPSVRRLMRLVEASIPGAEIRLGAFIYGVVGFAVWVPANLTVIEKMINLLRPADLNGDGIGDGVLLVYPETYKKIMNYMASRQLYIRPAVWVNLGIDGANVTVAVSDTGVDDSHAAFMWPQPKIVYWNDFVGGQASPYDDHSHGTHVAGTILGAYTTESTAGSGRHGVYIDAAGSGYYFGWHVFPEGVGGTIVASTSALIGPSTNIYYSGQDPLWLATKKGTLQLITSGNPVQITVNQSGWYYVEGTGLLASSIELEVPIENLNDGYPFMSGMAPKASLVMFKVCDNQGRCSSSAILGSINESIAVRQTYGIKVHNFSLGGGFNATEDAYYSNLAHSGIVVVVAAGNDGAGANYAGTGTPSANIYAITVAAVDHFPFNITSYSSQGGPSDADASVIKPDIACVGGGAYWMNGTAEMYSAATVDVYTNYGNWSLNMRGTSMATPCLSGVAALVIQAYEKYLSSINESWNYSSYEDVAMVKNIILMTAYETFPLLRNQNTTTYSPTLDKGGKDVHEGYGVTDPYAAVKAALSLNNPYAPGTVINGTFRRGAIYNGSVTNEFGPSVWAHLFYLPNKTITLPNGTNFTVTYKFKLYINTSDPARTDYDLYLYDFDGNTTNGEPVINASSVNGFGSNESISFTPAVDSAYIWVVAKRATENSSGGPWVLVTGPSIEQYGQPYGGTVPNESGQAWIGWPIKINGTTTKDVSRIVIEIWASNGSKLATLDSAAGDITIVDPVYHNYYEAEWIVPFDSNLVGQTLTIVGYYYDSAGTLTEGPVAVANVIVNDAPEPIPEPTILPIILVVTIALLAILYVYRRT